MEMDMELGEMGLVDSLGLSVAPPSLMAEGPESADAIASSMATVAAFAMTDQAPQASPSLIQMSEGLAGGFSGDMGVEAFGSPSFGGLPDVFAPQPDSIGSVSVPEAMPSVGPGTYATTEFPDSPDFSPVQDGQAGGMGNLPGIDVPTPQPLAFEGPSASVDELIDMQLSIAPPEPTRLDLAMAPDPPDLVAPNFSVAAAVGEHQERSLRALQQTSLDAFGPLGTFGESSSGAGASPGPSMSISIQNLHLPGTKASQAMGELLALSRTGTHLDISGLAA